MADSEILADVRASTGRRAFGVASVALLGAFLLYVAMANPPAHAGWTLFLLATAGVALWAAYRMYLATAHRIELTRTELRSSDGTCIARLDEIQAIDRGVFAFKPSNGFMLKLNTPAPALWRPGLWWRYRNRVGVGGVTPGRQTKAMADIIAALLAER